MILEATDRAFWSCQWRLVLISGLCFCSLRSTRLCCRCSIRRFQSSIQRCGSVRRRSIFLMRQRRRCSRILFAGSGFWRQCWVLVLGRIVIAAGCCMQLCLSCPFCIVRVRTVLVADNRSNVFLLSGAAFEDKVFTHPSWNARASPRQGSQQHRRPCYPPAPS